MGGGLFASGGIVEMDKSRFSKNQAKYGGAIAFSASDGSFEDVVFSGLIDVNGIIRRLKGPR